MDIVSEKDLLEFFIFIFPDFEIVWNSEKNYSRSDSNYTSHGVCAEFSHFFQENHTSFSNEQLDTLFNKIEIIITYSNDRNTIDNALLTCFLENIAQTKSGDVAKQFMGKRSKVFFNYWN